MANRVIIDGVRRGPATLEESELRQMAGRAGRDHLGGAGKVVVLAEEDELEAAKTMLEGEALEVVISAMTPASLAFHLLPLIVNGRINTVEGAEEWASRLFDGSKGMIVNDALAYLCEHNAVYIHHGSFFTVEAVGAASCASYFYPEDVQIWRYALEEMWCGGMHVSHEVLAWILGRATHNKPSGSFGKARAVLEMCYGSMPRGLEVEEGNKVATALWWSIMEGVPVGPMKNQQNALRDSVDRVIRAWMTLNDFCGWPKEAEIKEYGIMLKVGIPAELVWLVKLGLGKGLAKYLQSVGVKTPGDLVGVVPTLQGELEPQQYEQLVKIANSLL